MGIDRLCADIGATRACKPRFDWWQGLPHKIAPEAHEWSSSRTASSRVTAQVTPRRRLLRNGRPKSRNTLSGALPYGPKTGYIGSGTLSNQWERCSSVDAQPAPFWDRTRPFADVLVCACPCVPASARDQSTGVPCSAHVPRPRPAADASSFTSLRRAPQRPDPAAVVDRHRRRPPTQPAAGVGWSL
jgi:hypothetical protein